MCPRTLTNTLQYYKLISKHKKVTKAVYPEAEAPGGVRTLRHRDTLASRHLHTGAEVSRCRQCSRHFGTWVLYLNIKYERETFTDAKQE